MNANSTVIVGGGFVGLFTALHLRHRQYPNPVILIDAQDRFEFKPLLYEYLTGEMQEEQVTPTYAELLQGSDVTFVQDTVTQIDLQQRQVILASGSKYDYQHLVLAVGSIQGYFGTKGAKEHAFAFRTRMDVLLLQQHLQDCLERAIQTPDPAQRQMLLTVAVVGAGPSGVEIAATLADLLPDWYGQLGGNIQDLRIALINHGEEILEGDINTDLRDVARQALDKKAIPVELMLGVKVKSVQPDQIDSQAKDQPPDTMQSLKTATTIWTAGTDNNPLIAAALPQDCLDKHGQLLVLPTLQLAKFPEVFAAGDCATVQSKSLPQVAQVAYQQGAGIAENLVALSQGESLQSVEVSLRGTLMKLGIHNGLANLFNKVQIEGQAGDLIRNATYLEMLPTPLHNFKAVTEWLRDDIFESYTLSPVSDGSPPSLAAASAKPPSRILIWLSAIVLIVALVLGIRILRRSQQPHLPQPTQPQAGP